MVRPASRRAAIALALVSFVAPLGCKSGDGDALGIQDAATVDVPGLDVASPDVDSSIPDAAEAGDAGNDASDAEVDATDAGSDAGDAGSDATDSGSDVGDAGIDATDAGSEAGDAGSDSSDGGIDATDAAEAVWAGAQPLETSALDPRTAALAAGGARAAAAWRSYDAASGLSTVRGALFARGAGWGGAFDLQIDASHDGWAPASATNASGRAAFVWLEDGTYPVAMAAIYDAATGTRLRGPEAISDGTAEVDWVGVAVDAAGDVLVAFRERPSGWVVRHTALLDGASSWSTPVEAIPAMTYIPNVAFAVNASGKGVVVASQYEGVARLVDVSGPLGSPVTIVPASLAFDSVSLAVDDAGGAVLVDRESVATHSEVHAMTMTPAGAWSAIARVDTAGGDARSPVVALAPDGTATAAWAQRGSLSVPWRVWASRLAPGGAWDAPVAIDDATADAADTLSIAVDASGTAFVAWDELRAGTSSRDARAAARATGAGWRAPVRLSSTTASSTAPIVRALGAGEAAAVWLEEAPAMNGTRDLWSGAFLAP